MESNTRFLNFKFGPKTVYCSHFTMKRGIQFKFQDYRKRFFYLQIGIFRQCAAKTALFSSNNAVYLKWQGKLQQKIGQAFKNRIKNFLWTSYCNSCINGNRAVGTYSSLYLVHQTRVQIRPDLGVKKRRDRLQYENETTFKTPCIFHTKKHLE